MSDNASYSGRTASFEACVSADGGAAWWLAPTAPSGQPVPTAAQLQAGHRPLSGFQLPPDRAFLQPQQWLSGLRSGETPNDAPAGLDPRSSAGKLDDLLDNYFVSNATGPSNSWLEPGQNDTDVAVHTRHQLLFKNSALHRAQQLKRAIGTCAVGSTACIASRCSSVAGGASILLHWAGVGCGIAPTLRGDAGAAAEQQVNKGQMEGFTSFQETNVTRSGASRIEPFSWAPWFDAGLQVVCAFGGVDSALTAAQAVSTPQFTNATASMAVVQGFDSDVGATAFSCPTPPLADVAGPDVAQAVQRQAQDIPSHSAVNNLAQQVSEDNSSLSVAAAVAALASHVVQLSLLAVFPGSGGSLLDADASLLVLPVVSLHVNEKLAKQDIESSVLSAAPASRRRFAQLGGRVLPLSVAYIGGAGNTSCGCGAGSLSPMAQCTTIGVCQAGAGQVPATPHLRRRAQSVRPLNPAPLMRPPAGQVDCAGEAFGTAESSTCGSCTGGSTGLPSARDCAGVCGGSAAVDACGVCSGGTTGKTPNANRDCAGVCGGSAAPDCFSICSGGTTGRAPAQLDCAGICGGSARVDQCDRCSGGTTNFMPCNPDSGGGGGTGGGGGGTGGGGTGGGGTGGGGTGGGGESAGSAKTKSSDENSEITDAILLAAVVSFGTAFAVLGLCFARMRWRQRQRTEFAVEGFDDYEARQQQEGLHAGALDALPVVTFTASLAEGPGGAICTVCQEAFAKGAPVVELPCKHLFHKDCIRQWLQRRTTCVVCQYELAGWAIEVAPLSPRAAAPAGTAGGSTPRRGSRQARSSASGRRRSQAIELPTVRRASPRQVFPVLQVAATAPRGTEQQPSTEPADEAPTALHSNPIRR